MKVKYSQSSEMAVFCYIHRFAEIISRSKRNNKHNKPIL